MYEDTDSDASDAIPMSGGGISWKWFALPGLIVSNIVLQLTVGDGGGGYAVGLAFGALLWGGVIGGITWLVRGRKPGAFSSGFFWAATILSALMFAGLIGRA
jgi:hypothetical protein